MTAIPASSKGAAGPSFPDVCKVPSPGGPVPTPYPNTGALATSWDTTNAVQRVKLQSKHGVTAAKADALTSKGDEAGTMKGLTSVKAVNAPSAAKLLPAAQQVHFEGSPVVRVGDAAGKF